MSYVVGLSNNSYKPITNTAWVRARLCKLQKKEYTRLTAASDKVYQLLAHCRWFSPKKCNKNFNVIKYVPINPIVLLIATVKYNTVTYKNYVIIILHQ